MRFSVIIFKSHIVFSIRNILIFSIAIFTIIVCFYSAYLQYTSRYSIRFFSSNVEHWEGWCIKYSLEELRIEYPEFLPFVNEGDSCLHREHRRTGTGNTLQWEDADGKYYFEDIYIKKSVSNFVHHLPSDNCMPHPYLRMDCKGCLKPEMGKNIREGIYYISQLKDQQGALSTYKQYVPFGFFVEIQKEGWRIAGYDLCKNNVISLNDNGEIKNIVCTQHVSPLLEFNKKYKLRGNQYRQNKELIISVDREKI